MTVAPTSSEIVIAVARAAEDETITARSLLKEYLAEGADPAVLLMTACRLLATADKRLCTTYGREAGSWLNAVALKAARQRAGGTQPAD